MKSFHRFMRAKCSYKTLLLLQTFYKKSSEQQIRPVKLEREMAPSKRGRGRARPMVRAKFIKEPGDYRNYESIGQENFE